MFSFMFAAAESNADAFFGFMGCTSALVFACK